MAASEAKAVTRRRLPVMEPPEDLSDEDKLRLWTWHVEKWPSAFRLPNGKLDTNGLRRFLRDEIDHCLIYHRKVGSLFACWYSAVQEWVRRTHDRDGFARAEPKSSPLPRRAIDPYAKRHREPVKVGDVAARILPLFGGKL